VSATTTTNEHHHEEVETKEEASDSSSLSSSAGGYYDDEDHGTNTNTSITTTETIQVAHHHHHEELSMFNNDHTNTSHTNPEYLLSVPFYVYEEMLHDENLLNFTEMYNHDLDGRGAKLDPIPPIVNSSHVTFEEFLEKCRYFKHSNDFHFVRAALEHPNRVLKPDQAKLFVVPSLLITDIIDFYYFGRTRRGKVRAHIKRLDDFLKQSEYFQRSNGADHIAVNSLMRGSAMLIKTSSNSPLAKCNAILFSEKDSDPIGMHEEVRNNRTWFKALYNSEPCPITPMAEKRNHFAMVGKLYKKKYNRFYEDRRHICKWMKNLTNYTMPVCGYADSKCPHTSQAWLGFHARGDSLSADRLAGYLVSGTVPVFTLEGQYHAQESWYDWDKISYFSDVSNQTSFDRDVHRIMSNMTDIMIKTQNVRDNMDLFDWQTNVPFDVYMVSEDDLKYCD
jgi:hypothetical protein